MKNLAMIVAALGLLTAAVTASDAIWAEQSVGLGFTTVAASATSNSTAVIDVRKQQVVALQFTSKVMDSGTDNTVLTYGFSVDGTAPTAGTATLTNANNGTTAVVRTHLVTVGGAGFMHILSIANNDSTGSLTNLALKYGLKIP